MTRLTFAHPPQHVQPWPLPVRVLLAPITVPAVICAGLFDRYRTNHRNKGTESA